MSVLQIAQTLKADAGNAAHKVPTRPLPHWLLRVIALFDPEVKRVVPELGKRKNRSNEKARRRLGWMPRSPREAILATSQSLWEPGLLKIASHCSAREGNHGFHDSRFDECKEAPQPGLRCRLTDGDLIFCA